MLSYGKWFSPVRNDFRGAFGSGKVGFAVQKYRTMKTFRETESLCQMTFEKNGPFWHLYTSGKDTPMLFVNKEDFTLAMNLICQAAISVREAGLLAFEIMGNHVHLILYGEESAALGLFFFFRKRLVRCSAYMGGQICGKSFSENIKHIESLKVLRNNIVYVHRNGFVADRKYTPFSYPWGTGRYYFHDFPTERNCGSVFTDERRRMFRGRAPELPADYKIIDGYVVPSSYCALALGMSMFRDAHQYFAMLSKDVEAYRELAIELDDDEFLPDAELFVQICRIIREKYGLGSLRELSKAQKMELARMLHYDYRSSNGQIRRTLNMSQYEIDALFPLSAIK